MVLVQTSLFSGAAEQWADALHSWLGITDQHIHIVHTSADCRFRARHPKFVITSYNFLGKLKEDIETRDYRIVVVDESHYIKDWKVCSGVMSSICPFSTRLIVLMQRLLLWMTVWALQQIQAPVCISCMTDGSMNPVTGLSLQDAMFTSLGVAFHGISSA